MAASRLRPITTIRAMLRTIIERGHTSHFAGFRVKYYVNTVPSAIAWISKVCVVKRAEQGRCYCDSEEMASVIGLTRSHLRLNRKEYI